MGKAGGGRNEVDPRFMSMFSVYNMTFPSDNTVRYIHVCYVSMHVSNIFIKQKAFHVTVMRSVTML